MFLSGAVCSVLEHALLEANVLLIFFIAVCYLVFHEQNSPAYLTYILKIWLYKGYSRNRYPATPL